MLSSWPARMGYVDYMCRDISSFAHLSSVYQSKSKEPEKRAVQNELDLRIHKAEQQAKDRILFTRHEAPERNTNMV